MVRKDKRVRHRNPIIDKERGVMIVREIVGDNAICGYNDFEKLNEIYTFPKTELKLTQD